MVDDKLADEEAQRVARYEALKSDVKSDVEAEVLTESARTETDEAAVHNVARDLRSSSVDEVADTHIEVERGRVAARISQVVDYLFFVLYGLLTIRLLLELFAARESAGFFQFIKTVTGPFYAPFQGLMPSPSTEEGFTLALPIIFAIVVYMLLHLAVNGLLRILAHRKVRI